MLTEAFKGLVNLETVDIRDFCGKRERDGTYWNSWGATTAYEQTGIHLRGAYRATGSQSRFVSHVFSILMYSLGIAGRTPPRIEVLLRHQPAGLPDSAYHLPNFTFSAIQPVLQNLKALFLTLNLSDVSTHSHHTYIDGAPLGASAGRSLRHFLSCTPNLTHLRLNFQKIHVANNRELLGWLASPSKSTVLPPGPACVTIREPPPVNLPHLTALDLGQLDVDRETLLALLTKLAPKLEHLSLWRISIETGPYNPYDPRPNIWSRFFRILTIVPKLELKYLKVGALSQSHHAVKFKSESGGQKRSDVMREYSGQGMKSFIRSLEKDIVVEWPPEVDRGSEASNSDDDEEMYDNDNAEDENEDEDDD